MDRYNVGQIVAHIYNSPSADSIVNVWKKKALGKTNKIYDAQVITAQFLIDNIDKSFEIWEKQPWAHHYSFEEFCRYILPYRIGNEPLESWREMYYRKFSQKVDSVYSGNDIIQKIQAVRTISNKKNSIGKIISEIFLIWGHHICSIIVFGGY